MPGAAASRARIADLVAARSAPTQDLARLHGSIADELGDLLGTALSLEADVPLVLLPVRVEVRSTADQAAIRVRIYPDTVHAEALDEGLSDDERAAGTSYWLTVWADGDVETPWPTLTAAVGATRAAWVAEALRPTNLDQRPGVPPVFPDPALRGTGAAVARTLPDRFFVRVEQDGAAPTTAHGRPIPDELPVGLGDRDDLTVLKIDGEDLPPIDESLRWLVDYARAEEVGMAVTVALPVAGRSIRRLVVYGVRAALEPQLGAQRLTRLIRSHRFTDGAEFLPQGTPTNNTDTARAAWSKRTRPGPPDLADRDVHDADNAFVTAAALAVDPSLLATLPHAAEHEQTRAAALNRLLWSTTWAEAIEHLTRAGRASEDRLDSVQLDAVRDHWIANVRGRGPLPALRLGRQPYGILPIVVTDPATWQPADDGVVETALIPFAAGSLRGLWQAATAGVPTVMGGSIDETLPRILGTDATLQALRVRTALSPDPTFETAMALTIPEFGDGTAGRQVARTAELVAGVADDVLQDTRLGAKTRALALPLVHESDIDFVKGLLEPDPPATKAQSVLQVLLGHAAVVERHARDREVDPGSFGLLREVVASSEADVDRQLLGGALEAVQGGAFDDGSIIDAAEQVARSVGRLDRNALADRHPIPALRPATTLQQIAGVQPRFGVLRRSPIGLQLVGEVFQRARWAAAFQEALRVLAATDSIDDRRLLLAETLDCCSHRLDAWLTSAATRRLASMRAGGVGGTNIGAYGWLEDIDLATPADAGMVDGLAVLDDGADGGFIHAPGLAHAAAAGVLRSGRLTHRRSDPASEPLDLDLSSTRTRDALALLDGMRRGQSLGALLGYRLERRLHERSGNGLELDRFIYVLRTLAPLRAGKLTDPGAPVAESLAASDVVDGLRLAELTPNDIAARLAQGPKDDRYIPPGSWNPPTSAELAAVQAAIVELDRTHDAVADVLLAESVYQLVTGNPTRAAAALDALAAGESVPPEPEVVRTPRSGVPIQHRLAVVIPQPPPTIAGWDRAAARASAEPSLEAWAEGALGDPSAIPLAVGDARTMADAGVCALDVLFDADGDSVGASTLAGRLRRTLPDLGADLSPLAFTWELAGMLRSIVATARPLDIADVGRPVTEGATGRAPDTVELLARADAATTRLEAVVGDAAAIAALAPIEVPVLDGLDPDERAAALAAHEQALVDQAAAADDVLGRLAPFGLRPPPAIASLDPTEAIAAIRALMDEAGRRVAAARTSIGPPAPATPLTAEQVAAVIGGIFGDGFVALPVLAAPGVGEADLWSGAVGASGVNALAGAEIRPWLVRMARSRAGVAAHGEGFLVREARGDRPVLRVVQSPAAAFGTWVGLPFPDGRPPTVPIASTVAEVVGAVRGSPGPDLGGALAGLVLDEWTEVVARRTLRTDPADPDAAPTLVDAITTGVALNANAPGARPPQTILIACSPDGADWSGDRLVGVIDEAMALARMRAVTLDQIPFVARYLPALYFRDWSLQGEPVIDWLAVATEYSAANVQAYTLAEG